MNYDKTHKTITARVWQAIAQSGIDTSAIERADMEKLVESISDNVVVAVDEMLGEMHDSGQQTVAATGTSMPEQVLWEGRPFLSISEHYTITTERVRIKSGIFSRDIEDIELIRIQDIDFTQRLTERLVDVGDIVLHTSDPATPDVTLRNVGDPDVVHELLRRAMLDARKRNRVGFREEI
jgi:hypothetical protein